MLEHLFQHSRRQDTAVFWCFWICLILPELAIPDNRSPVPLDLLKFAALIAAGFILWRVLQINKLLTLKKVVIGVEGFAILILGTLMVTMLLFGVILGFLFIDHPQVAAVFAGLLILPGLFMAGYWLGFEIDKLIALAAAYGLLFAGLFWHLGILPVYYYLILVPILLGTYFARKRLATEMG